MKNLPPHPVKSSVQWLEVDIDAADQRIDNYLMTRLKGVPKSLVYKVLRKGEVRVNKGRVKPHYKLRVGDIVRVPPVRVAEKPLIARPSNSLQAYLKQAVLYEDDTLMVVNKPSGLAVHGGSGVSLGLIETLRFMNEGTFLELVHRLDRGTSGCVMVAKTRRGLLHMQQQLREGLVDKTYQALVIGRWPNRRQHIKVPLLKGLQASGERIVRAVEEDTLGAKPSLTRYRVLERYCGSTLVEAKPVTGRTHQIRVHSQYAGHPILGDDKYSDCVQESYARSLGLKRLFLHAVCLEFCLPSGQKVRVDAPLDPDLFSVLRLLSGEDPID